MFKNLKIMALASVSLIAIASQADAANLSTSGDIKIRNAITITENQKLDFGTIQKPTSTVTVQVNTAGALVGGGTTATHIDSSTVQEGDYTIAGSSLDTVDISATDNATVSGISFTALTGDYGAATGLNLLTGATNQAAPTAAGTALKVGATLSVTNAVAEGDYAPGFTITANYN